MLLSSSVPPLCHLTVQLTVTGREAGAFLEHVTVADVHSLKDNSGCYTVLPNVDGGIIDDAIVNKVKDGHYYVVANAGCADKDLDHLMVRSWCCLARADSAHLSCLQLINTAVGCLSILMGKQLQVVL